MWSLSRPAFTPPFLKSLYSINLESPPGTAFMTPLRIDPFPQFKPKPETKEVAKFRTKLNEKQPYSSTQFQFALVQFAKERVQNDIGARNTFLEGMASMATLLSNDIFTKYSQESSWSFNNPLFNKCYILSYLRHCYQGCRSRTEYRKYHPNGSHSPFARRACSNPSKRQSSHYSWQLEGSQSSKSEILHRNGCHGRAEGM